MADTTSEFEAAVERYRQACRRTVKSSHSGIGALAEASEDEDAAREALIALPQAGEPVAWVPEGWQLAPKEPTLEMQNAAWRWLNANGYPIEDIEVAPIYRAALSAAPSPPIPDADAARREGRERLTEKMIRAACKAFYETDNIDGVSLSFEGADHTFRSAFTRMWKAAIRARAAP